MVGAAVAGGYPAYQVGAVGEHLPGVEAADTPGDTLHDHWRVFVNQYGHDSGLRPTCFTPCRHHAFRGLGQGVGGDDGQTALLEN